jgi:hypothetical protein
MFFIFTKQQFVNYFRRSHGSVKFIFSDYLFFKIVRPAESLTSSTKHQFWWMKYFEDLCSKCLLNEKISRSAAIGWIYLLDCCFLHISKAPVSLYALPGPCVMVFSNELSPGHEPKCKSLGYSKIGVIEC